MKTTIKIWSRIFKHRAKEKDFRKAVKYIRKKYKMIEGDVTISKDVHHDFDLASATLYRKTGYGFENVLDRDEFEDIIVEFDSRKVNPHKISITYEASDSEEVSDETVKQILEEIERDRET